MVHPLQKGMGKAKVAAAASHGRGKTLPLCYLWIGMRHVCTGAGDVEWRCVDFELGVGGDSVSYCNHCVCDEALGDR
jgi:hypothetical protein